jgi:hypothetical protein
LILDGKNRLGDRINISDISESLVTIFCVKTLKFFVADPDPGPGAFLILDQGSGWKSGSGINISYPQHCSLFSVL